MNKKVKKRIGFDLDGVLADHKENRKAIMQKLGCFKNDGRIRDYIYGMASLDAGVMKGAKETIQKLTQDFDLFIISRRGPANRKYGKEWLKKHFNFPEENIFFVDKNKDKAEVIKKLNIGFYIDDRPSVLKNIDGNTKKFLFREETSFGELLENLK